MKRPLTAPRRSRRARAVARIRRRALVKATLACSIALLGIAAARALSGETIGPRGLTAARPAATVAVDYFPHRYDDRAPTIEEPIATF